MTRKRKHRAQVAYSADFETITDPEDCRVWVWGVSVIGVDNSFQWGKSIDEFIEFISGEESNIAYFHNLKFDGHFILDWLLRNGYRHSMDRTPSAGQFLTLISSMGMFYSITVKWNNGSKTEFRDSYKKLPFKVANIAKAWKLEEGKGEIDYHKPRPVGYDPDEDELDYLRRDVEIVASALASQFDEGMKALTVGSDSLAEYKRLTFPKTFTKQFPVLDIAADSDIRKAYRGGFTYADERYLQKPTRSGIALDVNSLYPYIMKDRVLPFGRPLRRTGKPVLTEDYPLSVFTVTFTAKLKKDHLPCIQVKHTSQYVPTDYQKVITDPLTLTVTNVDWDLYNDHYDIDVLSYDDGYAFQGRRGMFDIFIGKWMAVKENSEGGRRELAKLQLNSLYGKTATNPHVASKYPTMEDNKVKLKLAPEEIRDPVYTPAGVFITAYARDLTIRAAQDNFDTFAYADTDSLHLMRDTVPESIEVHPTKLGAWKREYGFKRAFYIRAKAYLEEVNDDEVTPKLGRKVNRIAGMPIDVSEKLEIDTVHDGQVITGKKVPRVVPGGIVLSDTSFTLKF